MSAVYPWWKNVGAGFISDLHSVFVCRLLYIDNRYIFVAELFNEFTVMKMQHLTRWCKIDKYLCRASIINKTADVSLLSAICTLMMLNIASFNVNLILFVTPIHT